METYEVVDLVNERYEKVKRRCLELHQMADLFLDEDDRKMENGPKRMLIIDKVHRHEGEWIKLEGLLSEIHACYRIMYEMSELKRDIIALGK